MKLIEQLLSLGYFAFKNNRLECQWKLNLWVTVRVKGYDVLETNIDYPGWQL